MKTFDLIVLLIFIGTGLSGFKNGLLQSIFKTIGYIAGGVLGLAISLEVIKNWESNFAKVGFLEVFDRQLAIIESVTRIPTWKGVSRPSKLPRVLPKVTSKKLHIFKFIQEKTLRSSLIYKMWLLLGAKSRVEEILLKYIKAFSSWSSYMSTNIASVKLTANLQLGTGWHYRYPGNNFQWTSYPDTRVILHSGDPGKYELNINLVPFTWGICLSSRIDCFINGKFFGTIDKTGSTFTEIASEI